MSLRERLIARIAAQGPISVEAYCEACLHDPDDGYYATRPRLGEAGDFITAPLVSQMFGELIGLWAARVWIDMGKPPGVRLVEIGPGDGTLMHDILRAARAAPSFLAAAEVWLVETSNPLRTRQRHALSHLPVAPVWVDTLSQVPDDRPLIIVANEFLDCLPIRQAVLTPDGWRERVVGLAGGVLAFAAGRPTYAPCLGSHSIGAIVESSPALEAFGDTVGALIALAGGAALFIDYGRATPETGDTLQALRRHHKEGPLERPGHADLTAHVDFPAFLAAAAAAGASAGPILTQGEWLARTGLSERAAVLAAANPDQARTIARQVARLTDADQMGTLFKAVCIHSAGLTPAAFERP